MNDFYYEVLDKCQVSVEKIIRLSNNALLLKGSKKSYSLKYMNDRSILLYEFLEKKNADILYPIKKIQIQNATYFLFPYYNNTNLGLTDVTKLLNNIIGVFEITKREYTSKLSDFNDLNAMYKVLDNKFVNLEMTIRQLEMTPKKTDESWLVLSKYHVILHAKKIMYQLQKNIERNKNKEKIFIYGLCHNDPALTHLSGGKLLAYNNSYFGTISSLLARFYTQNDHYSCDYPKLFSEYFKEDENRFYQSYFKFLVLYIYIINLRLDKVVSYESITSYIAICDKIKKFIYEFNDKKK